MSELEKMNKINKSETLANLLWTAFGVIGAIHYYSKADYWICGILSLIGVLYAYRLVKSVTVQ